MKNREPYWMYCDPQLIGAAMYPHILAMYNRRMRSTMAAELRDHVKRTYERHWHFYALSLHPILWCPEYCRPLDREHEPWEEYLLRRANLWEGRVSIARLLGYNEEEDFIRFVNRDLRLTLWQAVWRTRPHIK
jgi:hypothetical protein